MSFQGSCEVFLWFNDLAIFVQKEVERKRHWELGERNFVQCFTSHLFFLKLSSICIGFTNLLWSFSFLSCKLWMVFVKHNSWRFECHLWGFSSMGEEHLLILISHGKMNPILDQPDFSDLYILPTVVWTPLRQTKLGALQQARLGGSPKDLIFHLWDIHFTWISYRYPSVSTPEEKHETWKCLLGISEKWTIDPKHQWKAGSIDLKFQGVSK